MKAIKICGIKSDHSVSQLDKNRGIFFAIKGNNDDGHRYAKKVIKNKNNLSVISKNFKNKRFIKTQNTLEGLRNLASYARHRSKAKIIAITGSCGKTSLKNLLNISLSKFGKTHCSPKSFNNHFGAPYSLANLNSDNKFLFSGVNNVSAICISL